MPGPVGLLLNMTNTRVRVSMGASGWHVTVTCFVIPRLALRKIRLRVLIKGLLKTTYLPRN